MAKIGDKQYRFFEVDEWTNFAFLLPVLAPMSAAATPLVVVASAVLCVGSLLWHRQEDVLSRRFDELGMMMVLPALAAVIASRAFNMDLLLLGALPFWAAYYNYLDHTSSFRHIGYWSGALLLGSVYIAGWQAFIPVGMVLFGLWGQFSFPWNEVRYEHGVRHGLLWHLPVAAALYTLLHVTS